MLSVGGLSTMSVKSMAFSCASSRWICREQARFQIQNPSSYYVQCDPKCFDLAALFTLPKFAFEIFAIDTFHQFYPFIAKYL
jgi:hypothetical protein